MRRLLLALSFLTVPCGCSVHRPADDYRNFVPDPTVRFFDIDEDETIAGSGTPGVGGTGRSRIDPYADWSARPIHDGYPVSEPVLMR